MSSQHINCLLRKVNFSKNGPFFFLFSFYSKIKLDKIKKNILCWQIHLRKLLVKSHDKVNSGRWRNEGIFMERYQTMQPQKRNQRHVRVPRVTSSITHVIVISAHNTTQLSSHIVRDQSHKSFKLSLSINIFLIFPTNKHHEMR